MADAPVPESAYRERTLPGLPGSVLWTRTAGPGGAAVRVLPDGCADLIWYGGRLLVAGPDTRAHLATAAPGARHVGLRFAPGVAPAVLGLPGVELRDARVDLAALWPAAAVRAAEDLVAGSPGHGLPVLAARRLRDAAPDPVARAVLAGVRRGVPVTALADAVGLSERQLHRRCLAAFGYGPRTLARILRLDRALALARAGTPAATVAAETGYADQPHLCREVRTLAGVPLGRLLRP